MSKILVTGGAGYIGSHTCLALLEANYEVVVVDDLSNSSYEAITRVEKLSKKKLSFHKESILNKEALDQIFQKEKNVDAVIHFAAKKAVGESCEKPLLYYQNNISGTLQLLESMKASNVTDIVFSSSATVYGEPDEVPVKEDADVRPTNPYGQTKAMMEQILKDTGAAYGWGIALLRYFNPVGAHISGDIGEDPEYPNNLLPFVSQVAAGIRKKVTIFGEDYPTPDGTGVRDYIHVIDLAHAHVKALIKLKQDKSTHTYNIGTGRGYSVKEMVETFRKISQKEIPAVCGSRREGDVPILLADATLANKELGWQAEFGLEEMISTAWKWQSQNPKGYKA
ncbi:MAG: UDP-glucose 4-epimerase GalE [Lentisphaerales bacterium]|nr:UDP-glucose 4-epimerase GalE [Lentisphaerales bacterium]